VVEIELVIVNEKADITKEIKILNSLAFHHGAPNAIIVEADDYQTTLTVNFDSDSAVIDFAEDSLSKVPSSILSTIQRS